MSHTSTSFGAFVVAIWNFTLFVLVPHTDKNSILINEHTGKVVSLGPTVPGKKPDKKAADEDQIAYPVNATLDKDTGLQGDEPAGVLTQQPKKTPKARP
jgi:hypothetical protein